MSTIDYIGFYDPDPYELNQQKKISLSDLVNMVIDTELTEVEKIVIRKKYFEGLKCSEIKRTLKISNVYKVHDTALQKIYISLKYVIFYNIESVGTFDETFFRLVSAVAEKERTEAVL